MLNQTFRNLNRTREILAILIKYGFEDLITNSTLRNLVTERMRLNWLRDEKPVFAYTRWERIRMCCEELGPTFVKLGQILSNRPDMIPEPLIREFEKLQDRVQPFDGEVARQKVEQELGCPIAEVFLSFDAQCMASASIGQVHRAVLLDGTAVVVKVQRPDVAATIERDVAIIREVVQRADRYLKKQGVLNAEEIVNLFERSMQKELDYRNEARNLDRFRSMYAHRTDFYVPRPFRAVSSDGVLVMEFVQGCKITDMQQLREWELDPEKIVETGMDVYLSQIFEFGYFHGDPHPGNILVTPEGKIVLLDFGLVGQLMPKDRQAFAGIFIAMSRHDARAMAQEMKKLAIEDQITDMRQFTYELNDLIDDYASLDVSESNIAEVVTRLQKLMYDYRIVVPTGVFIIFRAFAILEGIGKKMHPQFRTYDFIRPYGIKLIQEQLNPEYLAKESQHRFQNLLSFLHSIPVEVRNILTKTNRGKLHFEIELQGYGPALKKWDSVTNRLLITLIICSLIIGSSIGLLAPALPHTPYYYGLPVWSFTGFSFAGFLFILLVYAILRRRIYK